MSRHGKTRAVSPDSSDDSDQSHQRHSTQGSSSYSSDENRQSRQRHLSQALPRRSSNVMDVAAILNHDNNTTGVDNDYYAPRIPSQSEYTTRPNNSQPTRTYPESRPSRPDYNTEQELFLWYHRTDLGLGWSSVVAAYNRQFHTTETDARAKGGLQCKLYRILEKYHVPKVREQTRLQRADIDLIGKYSMRHQTGLTFPWMIPEHRQQASQHRLRNASWNPHPSAGLSTARSRHT